MTDRPLVLGYWLSSEEHDARRLTDLAVQAEEAGFATAMISDHYHPWLPKQGESPFVWGVLGALARATSRLEVGTGVTAPIHRLHPAVIAQAAATAAALMPGRFFLGLGTGERLNEHITGRHWPRPAIRRAMLEEAVTIIRGLLEGDEVNHEGRHFTVEHARVFTRPPEPPPVFVAAGGRRSATLAGRLGDGLIGVAADHAIVDAFEAAGGVDKPRAGQVHVCWADNVDKARQIALEWWPQAALPDPVLTELARPKDFEKAVSVVDEDLVAARVVCGPDPDHHVAAIAKFAAAGFDRIYVHQVGPDQEGFFRFFANEVRPRLAAG